MYELHPVIPTHRKRNVVLNKATSVHSIKMVLDVINKFGGLIKNKSLNKVSTEVYYIISNEDKIPVGVTGYRPKNNWCVEQINTAIIPTFRGNGYGSMASSLLAEHLTTIYGKVFCTINSKNKIMLSIKIKQGFTIEGRLKNHWANGRDILILSRMSKQT
jgi:RimJ/RimL family protein N-acetyltransferase